MATTRVWRAAFGVLLALAMAIGSFGAFGVGVLAPFIVRDFGIPRASVGLLITILFLIAAVGSFAAGQTVDRFGGRRMLIAVFVLTAVALVGMGLAPTYAWLAGAVAVSGVASAMMNPSTNKLISSHLPPGSRGVIMGVKQSGVQGASFLAGLILPTMAVMVGWGGALVASSLLAVAGVVATLLLVPAVEVPQRLPGAVPEGGAPRMGEAVAWLAVYAFLMGSGAAAVTSFLVIYGVESLGMPEPRAGFVAAVLGFAGVVARVVWGQRAERLRSASSPLAPMAALGVVSVLLIWGAQAAGQPLLWAGAVLFGATATAWNAVGNLAIVRELPWEVAGRGSGVMQFGFYGGFVVCPVLFGGLVDVTGSYDAGWGMVIGFFLAATATAMLWERRKQRVQPPVDDAALEGDWAGGAPM